MSGPTTTSAAVLRGEGLTRVYGSGSTEVHALTDVDVEARPGELLVVRGRSGSGKTTLLNVLVGIDAPTSGRVHLGGRELTALGEDELLELRRTTIGYVFQAFGLLPVLSAAENVEVPLRLQRVPAAERAERVAEALELVGLARHAEQRPYELSGGQQQRVALARALVVRPAILVADEPTAQLDSGTASTVVDLLRRLVHEQGVAAVVSTHDPVLVERADRLVELHNGRLTTAGVDAGP